MTLCPICNKNEKPSGLKMCPKCAADAIIKILGGGLFCLLILSGCSTTNYRLVDPQVRSDSQKIVDGRACSIYHGKRLDHEYYYACMDLKGYKFEAYEKSDIPFFN